MNNLYASVSNKLSEIKDSILCYLHSPLQIRGTRGIMGDDFGMMLFLFHYAKTMNDKKVGDTAQKLAEDIVESLSGMPSSSYCDGWSGALLFFDYLRDNDFVDIEIDDIIDTVEKNIESYTNFCLTNRLFELLYGVAGVGIYWLRHNNRQMVDYIISALYNAKETDGISNGYRWIFRSARIVEQQEYNLSMSHGLVGMLLFVLRAFEKYGDKKAEKILASGINYMLSRRNNESDSVSLFPSVADSDTLKHSRLGWCYGDLGCGYLMYEAAKVCARDDWRNTAIDIYRHSSLRRTHETNMVSEAGLCHGAAGVAMMFRDIADKTHYAMFDECADYWLSETVKHSRFSDGLAGYKSLYVNTWHNDMSFLTGISGIGLASLSFLDSSCKAASHFLLP